MTDKPIEIMSGEYSEDMWKEINNANTVKKLQEALYLVCCRLQELETKYDDPKGFEFFMKSTEKKLPFCGFCVNLVSSGKSVHHCPKCGREIKPKGK